MAGFEQQQNFGGVSGSGALNANFNASVDQANGLSGGWRNNDVLLSNTCSTYMFKKFANVHPLSANFDNMNCDLNDGAALEGGLRPCAAAPFNMGNSGPAWMSNASLNNPTNWAIGPTFDASNGNFGNSYADISASNNFNMNNNFNGGFSGSVWNNRNANGTSANPLSKANLLVR